MAPEKEQSGLVSAPPMARKKYELYFFLSRGDVQKMRLTLIIAQDGFQQGRTSHSGDEKPHVTFPRTLTLWYCSAVNLSVQTGATGT